MEITFKLFATLMPYLPTEAVKNAVTLQVDEHTTPNHLIDRFQVPRSEVHLVLVNGIYLHETDRDRPLHAHDTLAIWPPVAGG